MSIWTNDCIMIVLKLKIEFDLDSSVTSRQVGWRQT
jgi:hypothetical protein